MVMASTTPVVAGCGSDLWLFEHRLGYFDRDPGFFGRYLIEALGVINGKMLSVLVLSSARIAPC